jgi:hypothetical protein
MRVDIQGRWSIQFSLDYEPRIVEDLYRKKISEVRDRIGFKYGYDSSWNNQYNVWMTASEEAELILEDNEWFIKQDIVTHFLLCCADSSEFVR